MRKTAYNLMIGFLRGSQTSIRYELYSEVAKKEKFILISRIFREFAIQEKEHANWFYQMIQQLKREELIENITVKITNPTTFGSTVENIESSIKEEDEEWQNLFPSFINTAGIEGYKEIANRLKDFSLTKRMHSQRLKLLLNLIADNTFSEKTKISFWKCMSCGFEIATDELSNDFSCPTCDHDKSYFQKKTLQLIHDKLSHQQKEISGWVCMECGYEVALEELPDDWECMSCGRSKAYFKRKTIKTTDHVVVKQAEKAHWVCLECGNEEDIEMPIGWKCSVCGYPKK